MSAVVLSLPVLEDEPDPVRPRTRGDCESGPRPCPWVSCRHHLMIEVSRVGTVKEYFRDVDEMTETCSLDVADRGGMTLLEVGHLLRLTRERIRQIEVKGLAMMQRDRELRELADDDD